MFKSQSYCELYTAVIIISINQVHLLLNIPFKIEINWILQLYKLVDSSKPQITLIAKSVVCSYGAEVNMIVQLVLLV